MEGGFRFCKGREKGSGDSTCSRTNPQAFAVLLIRRGGRKGGREKGSKDGFVNDN